MLRGNGKGEKRSSRNSTPGWLVSRWDSSKTWENKNTTTGVQLTTCDIGSCGLGGAEGVLAQGGPLEVMDVKGRINTAVARVLKKLVIFLDKEELVLYRGNT